MKSTLEVSLVSQLHSSHACTDYCLTWHTALLTGFATKYIKQRFFMDVHPPLAKLMITFVAWFAGYRGNFDFKDIGK